jgi:hypothetical protein
MFFIYGEKEEEEERRQVCCEIKDSRLFITPMTFQSISDFICKEQ